MDPGKPESAYAIVNHLASFINRTPLDIFAGMFLGKNELAECARSFFGTYDRFLKILDDTTARDRLDRLRFEEVADDKTYQEVRQLSHEFQEALDNVFFSPEHNSAYFNLTKLYGVF
jgi:hypothetical protein